MPSGSQVSLGYNSARINEATGNFQAAAAEYRGILEAFPGKLLLSLKNPSVEMLASHRTPLACDQPLSAAWLGMWLPQQGTCWEGTQQYALTSRPPASVNKEIVQCKQFLYCVLQSTVIVH